MRATLAILEHASYLQPQKKSTNDALNICVSHKTLHKRTTNERRTSRSEREHTRHIMVLKSYKATEGRERHVTNNSTIWDVLETVSLNNDRRKMSQTCMSSCYDTRERE